MGSSLFQVRMNDADLRVFRSPLTQPSFNPKNCGAVTGQLLGLVTPNVSNQMTELSQGVFLEEWETYVSSVLDNPVKRIEQDISKFESFFNANLFPGFGTLVLTLSTISFGHYFVVAKSVDGRLVILDPQLRVGYFSFAKYKTIFPNPPTRFIVLLRNSALSASQHENDSLAFLAKALETCTLSTGEVYMDIDKPPKDVVMEGTGRRKRRKTKRRSLAKRTLRRVNRRRRIL